MNTHFIPSRRDLLLEELAFDRSMVMSLDWASYPILTFPGVPEIAIELIDRPSAISNAVFDATSVRMRSVPYTPEKMKVALHAA